MATGQGRLEKRIRLAVQVQIVGSGRQEAERTTTENVCAHGVRVLARRPLQPMEQLLLIAAAGDQRTQASVIYCERLPDGLFAAGLQIHGKPLDWSKAIVAG